MRERILQQKNGEASLGIGWPFTRPLLQFFTQLQMNIQTTRSASMVTRLNQERITASSAAKLLCPLEFLRGRNGSPQIGPRGTYLPNEFETQRRPCWVSSCSVRKFRAAFCEVARTI